MEKCGKEEADEEPCNSCIFEDVDKVRDEESGHHGQHGRQEFDDVIEHTVSGGVFGFAGGVAAADDHEDVVGDCVDEERVGGYDVNGGEEDKVVGEHLESSIGTCQQWYLERCGTRT